MKDDDLDASFRALEKDVVLYSRTWWIGPESPARVFLEEHPEVRRSLNSRLVRGQSTLTAHVYASDTLVNWHEQRVALHHEMLDALDTDDSAAVAHSATAADTSAGTAAPADAATRSGDVYFVLGLPGSGKTKVLRRIAAAHASSLNLASSDADDVRIRFPEYADGHGSGVVQMETVVVTYGELHLAYQGRQDRVLSRGGHAIVDVIGDPDFLPATVESLAQAGRKCFLLLTECPVEVCQLRAMRRAVTTGRFVPLELIESKEGVPREALNAALTTGLVAGWAVIDTSGETPKSIDGDGTFEGFLEVSP